ncbi:MAG: Glycosyl transferase family 2 [Desulfonauticus sp. 38_4375]|nr:MAG: Glycosyl transferase family 2 [Desulfonauticus sp. 38_4375]
MSVKATGLVLTFNGEKYLEKCLQSLSFCQEILVVDSESTDATREIAQSLGARVLVNPWPGPGKQFEYAFKHIKTQWVVSLDQDEILSPELQKEIIAHLQNPRDYVGFYCPRRSFYFDRFLKHSGWYPDYLLRVFSLPQTNLHISEPHYGFKPQGKTKKLKGDIIHFPYTNLSEHLNKINYYTQEAAKDLASKGVSSGLFKALGHGLARFLKIYLFKQGFRDGQAGFILALNSFFYGFLKYIKILEIKEKNLKKNIDNSQANI